MKHQDEFRTGTWARPLAALLKKTSRKPVRLMEICGTHTVSIFRHGLRDLLPPTVRLVSGPGCPVCVTATEEIDRAIKLAYEDRVRLATFGDLIRVPGSTSSLKEAMALGARVSMVYSPLDAVDLARKRPDEEVVFLGIGFETTAPTVAASVLAAAKTAVPNFSVLSAHKLLPPAMNALLAGGRLNIDGFICPGHVTTIIGTAPYEEVVRKFKTPCVVTGFEPVDILQGILMLVEMLEQGRAEVAIQYQRGASARGNPKARAAMDEVFVPQDAPWRGLGRIPDSGLDLNEQYREFNARLRFDVEVPPAEEPPGCRCGDVLRGEIVPPECPLFGKSCRPERPVGPCMVSTEGTCAAHFAWGR